ncbi:hypothetical protein TNCV_4695441 [Trichonephila clavipes]|nr:hypothetical protein TNCV_4695441 [Trichonephila clavipes]
MYKDATIPTKIDVDILNLIYRSFAPTRQAQVAACKRLRDTVTGISALHISLHDGRSHSPQSSFAELYWMSTQAMIKRKEEMATATTTSSATRIIRSTNNTIEEIEKRFSIWIDGRIERNMLLSQSTFLIQRQKIENTEEIE